MAKDIVEYIKGLISSFSSTKNSAEYDEERKKLEEHLAGSGNTVKKENELPNAAEYERMDYKALSDEEIESRVREELNAYYNESVNAIDSEIEALDKKYNADKNSVTQSAQSTVASAEKAFGEAKESLSNDSLKRGLARSSIAVNKQSEVEKLKADAINKINTDLSERISEIDTELNSLAAKREKALNDFNIAYASKLTGQINTLKDERESKKLEALKYNNTLTEKEFNNKVDLTMKQSDLENQMLSRLSKTPDSGVDYAGNFEVMRAFLGGLDADEAKRVLKDDRIFRDNLSDYYFFRLRDEFGVT